MLQKRYHGYMILILIIIIGTFVSPSQAKMTPLKPVQDLLVRPNILIIFDTSGSMSEDVNGDSISWETREPKDLMAADHPESRMYIAKEVVKNVLNESRTLANFALFSFYQTHYLKNASITRGYFPYLRGSSTTITRTKYFSRQDLNQRKYTVGGVPNQRASSGRWDYQPVNSFEYRGITYTLKSTDNSQYRRRYGRWGRKTVTHNYCGYECVFPDPDNSFNYTWVYRGSYYEFTEQEVSEDRVYFKQYYGKQFVADGTEDNDSGASQSVNPGDVFVYYPGELGRDFKYNTYVNLKGQTQWWWYWKDSDLPIGAAMPEDGTSYFGAFKLVRFSYSQDQSEQDAKVDEILRWMQPCNDGGLVATGGTPTGNALAYVTYLYFKNDVLVNDPLSCRKNYVLFITDGEPYPSSQGEVAETAAENLLDDLDVRTYMIGFGEDTRGSETLDDIAENGGCPLKADGHYAYYATNEAELTDAIKKIIYEAATGDYATSAPTSGSASGSRMVGNIGLLATCEFPDWKGHLTATDLSTGSKLWDAGEQLDANHIAYNARKIYTSNASGSLVPFFVSGSPNTANLNALGLGSSLDETKEIIEFISGKDRFWRLNDVTNCTPIAIGPPYVPEDASAEPGHEVFESTYANRGTVVYSGGNDCMLHCFSMCNGSELFTYIPPDLFPTLKQLFINGGQPSDPAEHIYGVAASPKAFDAFIDGAWKTIVVCGEGPGGYQYFALDVTHPSPGDYLYDSSQPFSVLWHTGNAALNATYDPIVGESWSTAALGKVNYMPPSSAVKKTQYVAMMGSGYDDPDSGDAEGITFQVIQFEPGSDMGTLLFSKNIGSTTTIVDHGLVADGVCVEENGFIKGAYAVDTAGRIWYLDADGKPSDWSMNVIYNATVDQPFFYSPPVIQVGTSTSACTMLAAVSGTYDDPAINDPNSSFVSKLHLLEIDNSHALVDQQVIPFTDITMDPNTGEKFPQRSRAVSSAIIIRNETSSQIETVFLVYVPPVASGCDPGNSYLVVYKLGAFGTCGFGGTEWIVTLDAGQGKVTGIDVVGDPSAVLVGVSGHGSGAQSTLKTVPATSSFVSGTLRQLYWKEYTN
ncbi:MAG: pilus assembly protein [bacterium]